MNLQNAVEQVGADENIESAYIRLFGDQINPEQFTRWFQVVRQVPAEFIPLIQEHAKLAPHEAFRKCFPDYVDIGKFMDAVIESRTLPAVPAPVGEGTN